MYDKEGGNMAGVRNKERMTPQDVEEGHAPVLPMYAWYGARF